MAQIQGSKAMVGKVIVMAIGLSLLTINNVEAGMFNWLKRTEIQWSPPIQGVITEQGRPLAGIEVKRELYYDGKEHIESSTTDSKGNFQFPSKTLKVSRVLFDVSIALEIFAYPEPDKEEMIFQLRTLNDLNYKSLNIITSEIHCDLKSDLKQFKLRNLENPENNAPSFSAKCSFPNSGNALISDKEIEEELQEMDRMYEEQERKLQEKEKGI